MPRMKRCNVANIATHRALLRDQSLQALLRTWTGLMIDLGNRISALPSQPGDDPMLAWGFVFAIDSFRYNEPAVCALLRVVRDMTVRPTYSEVFGIVDASLALRAEVNEFLANRKRDGVGLQEWGRKPIKKLSPIRTTGKIGFVRGN
jgi:hypothetical protein